MIKLKNKSLKAFIAVGLIALPNIGFSTEMPRQQLTLTANQYDYVTGVLEGTTTSQSSYTASAKSEEGGKKLIGTWIMSYHNGTETHTDKIIINGITTSDNGGFSAVGAYFPDQFDAGLPILCFDNNTSAYSCFSQIAENEYINFLFIIAGDAVSDGFFGSGDSIETADNSAQQRKNVLVGLRPSSVAKYDGDSGELVIPGVEYQGKFYQVTLKDQGGLLFGLQSADLFK